jgi:predicted transcriptional regulator
MRKTTKQAAIEAIERLPANASLEQIMYELYVRTKVEQGLADIENGRVVSHEDVRKNMARWLRSPGR